MSTIFALSVILVSWLRRYGSLTLEIEKKPDSFRFVVAAKLK